MIRYIIKRLLLFIPVVILMSICIFTIIKLTPGDPVGLDINPDATAEQLQAERERLGLHLPVPLQYLNWAKRAIKGDFGPSTIYNRPVSEVAPTFILNSLKLNLTVFILTFLISIPVGIVSAVKQHSFTDNFWGAFSVIGISVPSFFFGLLLIYFFSVKLRWLPVGGMMEIGSRSTGMAMVLEQLKHMILPALVIALGSLAGMVRYTRTSMLDVINQDYIRTARSKGLTEKVVIYKHGLRNALLPVITLLGFQLPALFSGSVITETIFRWPGIGQVLMQSISSRDYNLMMALMLFFSMLTLLGNLLADIGYALVDPRIKVD